MNVRFSVPPAFRIVLYYAFFGVLWIFFSDLVVFTLGVGASLAREISTIKGTAFVIGSSLLIYVLVRRSIRRIEAQREQYRVLLERMPLACILTDAQSRVRYWNPAAEVMFGYSADEIAGMSLREAVGRQGTTTAGSGADGEEEQNTMKDGSGIRCVWRTVPVVEEHAADTGRLSIVEDVTEARKLAARAAAQRKERDEAFTRLRMQIDNLPIACIVADPDMRITDWNTAAEALFGFTREDMLGKSPVGTYIPSELETEFQDLIGTVLHERTTLVNVNANRTRDGRTIVCQWTTTPLTVGDGQVAGLLGTAVDVTGRAELEERNRRLQSERDATLRRLQIQFESMPAASIVTDSDLRVVNWNPAAEQIFGYGRDEAIGRNMFDVALPEEERQQVMDAVQELIAGRRSGISTNHNVTKDGRTITCEWNNVPLYGDDGRWIGLLAMATDITGRLERERALQLSEQRYRLLAENVDDVIWILDMESGRFRYVSPSVEKLRGWTPEEIVSAPLADALTPDSLRHLEHVLPSRMQDFANGSSRAYVDQLEQPCKDGSTVWTETTSRFVTNDITGQLEVYGVSRNITERMKQETMLRESEHRYRQLAENIDEMFWLRDLEHDRLLYVNPTFERFFDLRRNGGDFDSLEVFRILVLPEDLAGVLDSVTRSQAGRDVDHEFRVRLRDGSERWVHMRLWPVYDDTGRLYRTAGLATDITERKRAEARLQKLLAERDDALGLYYKVLNDMPVACIVRNAEFSIVNWNAAAEQIFGFSAGEMVGATTDVINVPSMKDEVARVQREIREGRQAGVVEAPNRTKDGRVIRCEWRNTTLSDSAGVFLGAISMVRDVTEQRQLENERIRLQQERDATLRRLQLQFDAMPIGCILATPSLQIIDWNAAAERIFGFTREEMVGVTPFRRIIPEHLEEAVRDIVSSLPRLRRTAVWSHENHRKDGTVITCEWHDTPLFDEDGTMIGVLAMAMDISERLAQERALLASEERYRQLAESIDEAFWLRDVRANCILYVNPAFDRIYGIPRERFLADADAYTEWVHPEDAVHVTEYRRRAETEAIGGIEYRIVRPDGEIRWLSVRAFPILDDDGNPYRMVGLATDITMRKRTEEELLRKNEHLRLLAGRLSKVEEAERRAISRELHDQVGQNLTALNINLSLIRQQLQPDALERVGARLDDSLGLVENTVERTRDIMGELRPVMLDDYGFCSALRWLGDQFMKRTGVRTDVDCPHQGVRFDPVAETMLYRIAQEALTNVAKHADANAVHLRAAIAGNELEFLIEDDGEGFDFASAGRRTAMHGWGLETMHERIEAIGGTIRIDSAPGQGTRIAITLPLERPASDSDERND